jgi:hypothetical protein
VRPDRGEMGSDLGRELAARPIVRLEAVEQLARPDAFALRAYEAVAARPLAADFITAGSEQAPRRLRVGGAAAFADLPARWLYAIQTKRLLRGMKSRPTQASR